MTREGKDVAAGGKGKCKYTQAHCAKIDKYMYAAENGNTAAVRHFSKVFPGLEGSRQLTTHVDYGPTVLIPRIGREQTWCRAVLQTVVVSHTVTHTFPA